MGKVRMRRVRIPGKVWVHLREVSEIRAIIPTILSVYMYASN